jgi:phage shock protein PspC (stress-responsive transcriptional regulator)
MIAGVASGLGRKFDLDPWWFRVGFIVLTIFGGVGVVLYVVGWLLMPDEGEERGIAARFFDDLDLSDTAAVVGVVLVAVALVVVAANLNIFSGQLVFAAILFVVGILLWRGDVGRRSPRPPTEEGEAADGEQELPDEPPQHEPAEAAVGIDNEPDELATEETDMTDHEDVEPDIGAGLATASASLVKLEPDSQKPGNQEPLADEAETIEAEVVITPTAPVPPTPPPPRPRSILGGLTMAAVLIALGGLALADVAGWLYPDVWHYLATALGVIGIGLLVGTFLGRARWMIVIGILLAPMVLIAATASAVIPSWDFGSDFGDRIHTPAEVTTLSAEYELAAGSLVVDLSGLDMADLGAETRDLEISVGAGEVQLSLPEDMVGTVEANVGIGRIEFNGSERVGIGPEETIEFPDNSGSADEGLQIEVNVGAGNVEIHESEGSN